MRALFASFVLFGLLGVSVPALAQNTPSIEEMRHAKQLAQTAEIAFQGGDYNAALEDYVLSYSLSQDVTILFQIAQCHHKLSHYEDAIRYYQEYLDKGQGAITPEDHEEAESLLLEARELSTQKSNNEEVLPKQPRTNLEDPLFWSARPSRTYAPYLAVSGLSLLSAAVSATFAIQTINTIESEATSEFVSSDQLKQGRTLSLLFAAGADALVLTSAITGTIGVLKWREQKRELSAKANASSLWIQLRY